MPRKNSLRITVITVLLLLGANCVRAQFINEHGPLTQPGKDAAVEFVAPDQVTVPTAKATHVLLYFRVRQGLHINSHAPHDEFLIPTTLTLPEGKGVQVDSVVYPQGKEYVLPADGKTRLNVYAGAFAIDATMRATAGEHVLAGKLRVQACDQRQCMPPKAIPITVVGTGK